MSDFKSDLIFKTYIVRKIEFERNINYIEKGNGIDIDLKLGHDIKIFGNEMHVMLNAIVFDKMIEKNYPFKINVIIEGIFETSNKNVDIFKNNAIAILFPYIRTLISTYTANSNVPTLVLPTINVNKYIEEAEKHENQDTQNNNIEN